MSTPSPDSAAVFARDRYLALPGFVAKPICNFLTNYMFMLSAAGHLEPDNHGHGVYAANGFETLLVMMIGPLSKQLGVKLLPTYSYARVYRTGEDLVAHVDRPECEISVSLTLGYEAESIWPIYMGAPTNDPRPIALGIGDIVVYRGIEVPHFRKAFNGRWHMQAFLHYVDAAGPYANRKYDGRPDVGTPASS